MKLTKAERKFLIDQGIEEIWLFDASRMPSKSECKRQMQAANAAVAVGLQYCEYGHRLTNGKGTCLQCYPGQLTFIRRWMDSGLVYLAESKSLGLIKVGTCKDAWEREFSLNMHTYAGGSDWVIKTTVQSSQAGQFEHMVTQALANWREEIEYERYGKLTYGREVFRCTYRRANAALKKLLIYEV